MLLILVKGKLIHTDNILPIIAALRTAKFNDKITLIYPSQYDLSTIKSNKELFNTLTKLVSIKKFYAPFELKKKKFTLFYIGGFICIP